MNEKPKETKNNLAWSKIFNQYNIIQEIEQKGHYDITSKVINKYRESRLMTKFDNSNQLPEIFYKNNLSILPTARGAYSIGTYKTFKTFGKQKSAQNKLIKKVILESLDYNNITTESQAINCAFQSRVLNDFTNEDNLYSTINGRMSSSIFNFYIDTDKSSELINVNNAQIEIDAGFEGENGLYLLEAKNYFADDFIIRQLYYPYRLWLSKIRKSIHPIFFIYSNGRFYLKEYQFNDINNYNSIELVKEQIYSLIDIKITKDVIYELSQTPCITEPKIPFPQADSFEKIINIYESLESYKKLYKAEIYEKYAFNPRQANYYSDALVYLGLANKVSTNDSSYYIELSELGNNIFHLTTNERQLRFIKLILSHKVFQSVLIKRLNENKSLSYMEIVTIMKESNLYNINSESTFKRRASTIRSWINWVFDQINA